MDNLSDSEIMLIWNSLFDAPEETNDEIILELIPICSCIWCDNGAPAGPVDENNNC